MTRCRLHILFAASWMVVFLLVASTKADPPVSDGLVGWWDVSDSSTVQDRIGRNADEDRFSGTVHRLFDKALDDGAQNAEIMEGRAFRYRDGSNGLFNNNPYMTAAGNNSLGFDDLGLSETTVFYVMNVPGDANVAQSIAQLSVNGQGAIVYNRHSSPPATIDQGGVTTLERQLMVGIRGGKEFFSESDMFQTGIPAIITWSYGGGDQSPAGLDDPASFKFYKSGAPWGPVETCCAIGGSASDNRIGKEAGPGLAADWAEVLIYNRVLADNERNDVSKYLGDKHGIEFVPPPPPPVGYVGNVLADKPVALFSFEEDPTTGTATDNSNFDGSQEGTYVGGVTSVPGLDGSQMAADGRAFVGLAAGNRAAMFDGTSGRVDVPDVPEGVLGSAGKWTVEFLMKSAAEGGRNQTIAAKGSFGGGTSSYVERSEGNINVAINSGVNAISSAPEPAVDEWTHVAAVFTNVDGAVNDFSIYINGQLESNAILPGALQMDNAGEQVTIGGLEIGAGTFGDYFNGALDEVAFYTKALNEERILAHYEALFEALVAPFEPKAGDANEDRSVDTADIVQILAAAKFETQQPATFGEGDFTGDGFFDTADIVAMLAEGLFETGPYASLGDASSGAVSGVPEPATWILWLLGAIAVTAGARRRR